jgi:hypothetical protein
VPPQVIRRIPPDMAAEFRIIPIEFDREHNLVIAMAEPSDTHAIDEIGFFTGCFVMRAVAPASAIAWALEKHYGVKVAAAPRAPVDVAGSSPSAAVIVSRPPELSTPTVAAAPAKKKAAAVIVEDVFGEDTPLPPPVPFDTTGQVPKVDLAAPDEEDDDTVIAEQFPDAISEAFDAIPQEIPDARVKTIPNRVPPPPAGTSSAPTRARPPTPAPNPGLTQRHQAPINSAPPRPAPRPKDPTPPPSVPPAVLNGALERLEMAADRDEIAGILVGYLAHVCRRAALFVVRKGSLHGWLGKGDLVHQADLKQAALSLDRPSTFRDVVHSRLPLRGPVVDTTSRDFLIEALGWAPDDIVAMPISVRDKVVSVLYGDSFTGVLPIDDLNRLARGASEALERALAARKGA